MRPPRWFIGLCCVAAIFLGVAILGSVAMSLESPSAVAAGGKLPPDELLSLVMAERPGRVAESMTIWKSPGHPVRVAVTVGGAGSSREEVDVDPATGQVIAPSAGRRFSAFMTSSTGRSMTIAALIVMSLVCAMAWRRAAGRGLPWRCGLALVSAAVLLQILAAAAVPRGPRESLATAASPAGSVAEAWARFDQLVGAAYGRATLSLPLVPKAPLRFEFTEPGAAFAAAGRVEIDPSRGEAITLLRHADLPWAERWRGDAPSWANGSAFGSVGIGCMSLAALLMPGFALGLRRFAASAQADPAPREGSEPPMLVAYASQSGTAESLARRSAAALRSGGVQALVKDLADVTPEVLGQARRALFIVATTGSGEAPDHARPFARRMAGRVPRIDLQYGLLALGDLRYDNFCGFGRSVGEWLDRAGATPLFEPIAVDGGDREALGRWQSRINALGQAADDSLAWHDPGFARWRLAARRHLNPGSAGLASFHVELGAIDPADAAWQAGDIAEIRFGEMVREYSIASIPQDGAVHLLVRQTRREDGGLGLGSGWLTERLAEGDELAMRIRSNAGFHAPPDVRPLLLIGNGTGLAGLRAHLRARVKAGQRRNWLIFGERNQAHDYYHRDEIEAWLAEGWLERLDLAFSRDAPQRVHVQHRLHAAADALRAWLADGAAIYICGSSVGMAPEVEAVLTEVIGAEALDALVAEGRYRRDVY